MVTQRKYCRGFFVVWKFLNWKELTVLVLGSGLILVSSSLANSHSGSFPYFSRCKTTLEGYRDHISNQTDDFPYYESLLKQISLFLDTTKGISTDSSHLDRCEQLITALQEIVGTHVQADLVPMPAHTAPLGGSAIASPTKGPKRPLRKIIRNHIQYEDDTPFLKNVSLDEEEEAPDHKPLKRILPATSTLRNKYRTISGELDEPIN